MAIATNPADQQGQTQAEAQHPLASDCADSSVSGDDLIRQERFRSAFLRGTSEGSILRHADRSRWRARLRSARRKEELFFGRAA
jgi:hypothetical protein